MENPKVTPKIHNPRNGQWVLGNDDKIYWEELLSKVGEPKETKLFKPTELGLLKEFSFSIVIAKQILTHETLDSAEIAYYLQNVHIKIRDGFDNIYLLRQGNKIFIKDCKSGMTFESGLRSNEWTYVTKTEFRRVTLDAIKELEKTGRLILTYSQYDKSSDSYGLSVQ